jgi:hypothetical protein
LEIYEDTFIKNGFNDNYIFHHGLNDDDFDTMHITIKSHIKKIKEAIKK